MDINKTTLQNFRMDFSKAVAELEKKYNVKVNQGKIGFTSTEFTMKITVNSLEEKAVEAKKSNLDHVARAYGIPFKNTFTETKYKTYDGKVMMVKEIKRQNHKYPFIATCLSDGKSYKLSVAQLSKAEIV